MAVTCHSVGPPRVAHRPPPIHDALSTRVSPSPPASPRRLRSLPRFSLQNRNGCDRDSDVHGNVFVFVEQVGFASVVAAAEKTASSVATAGSDAPAWKARRQIRHVTTEVEWI